MVRTTTGAVWASAMILGACHGGSGASSVSSSSSSAPKAPSAPVAAAPSVTAAAPLAPSAPAALVDLLHAAPAEIAVSSTVNNPTDKPGHLVDGQLDTAWNSKTGDVNGAWIAFRVPQDASVDHLEMTAGFDKTGPQGDLFTMNPRIRAVRIYRAEEPIRQCDKASLAQMTSAGMVKAELDRTLDPNVRGLQRVPVELAGGDYCVVVTDTLPGTKSAWRELALSEFRVMGAPGREARDRRVPVEVTVQHQLPPFGELADVDPRKLTFEEGKLEDADEGDVDGELRAVAFPTVGALCAEYTKRQRRLLASQHDSPYPGNAASVSCVSAKLPVLPQLAPPFRQIGGVTIRDGWTETLRVVVETARGFLLTALRLTRSEYGETDSRVMWSMADIEAIGVENGQLVVTRDWFFQSSSPLEYRVIPMLVRGASICGLSAAGMRCREWTPTLAPPLGVKLAVQANDKAPAFRAYPWQDEVAFTVDSDGNLYKKP